MSGQNHFCGGGGEQQMLDKTKLLPLALLTLSLGGCFFPDGGPDGSDIRLQAEAVLPYALVPLTPQVVDTLIATEPKGFAATFRDRRPPANLRFGVGDVVSVTIFEAAAGGLFIPAEGGSTRPGNFVTLPEQPIDNDGNISVPYAGLIRAAGRYNTDIQRDIVAKIRSRAIEPQAIVTLTQQRTNMISVIGAVNTPTRFAAAMSGAGDRLTDAIARAGGIKYEGYETWVALERDKRRASAPFAAFLADPANNVFVQPGDRLYVYREPQRFIAFGASGQQGQYTFDDWRLNLSQAVAKSGGLIDSQADPGSVFLYRLEPPEVAQQLGVDLQRFPDGRPIPVILSVNFRDPSGYFLSTKVQMHNEDVIFVANAQSVEVTKFLNLMNLALGTANQANLGVSWGAIARYNVAHPTPPVSP